MFEEVPKIEMPPRSRLYSLPMQGSCGATQESIFDYAQRLSAKHHVSPRRMFAEVYLPEVGRHHLISGGKTFNPHVIHSLNGTSDFAHDFAAGMRQLTGRQELRGGTFLAWRGMFGRGMSFAPNRRWCPCCLADQGAPEHYAFALLWSVAAVTACPIHKVRLSTLCGGCGKAQPRLSQAAPFGKCAYCRCCLAAEVHVVTDVPDVKSLRVSAAAAMMIAVGDKASTFAQAENYRERLRHLVATHFAGSSHRFARELKVGRGLLRSDGTVPFNNLLELTYRLGTTPVAFLTGQVSPQVETAAVGRPHDGARARLSGQRLTELKSEVIKFAIELDQLSEPLPMAVVARRLDVSTARLNRNFPEVMDALRRHNLKTRPVAAAKRDAAKTVAIQVAMRALVERGDPTTNSSIWRALRQVGVSWQTPKIMAASRAELARLRTKTGSCSAE